MKPYPKNFPQPDKRWYAGDKGWICYKYTGAGVTVVEVEVERRERSPYLSVFVPSMLSFVPGFQNRFGCICFEHQVYATKEKAEQVAAEINAEPQQLSEY